MAWSINGLRFNIQNEVGMLKTDSIEHAYQYALKEEDKLKRGNQGSSRGKEKQDHSTKDKPSMEDESKHVEPRKRMGKVAFKDNCFHYVE